MNEQTLIDSLAGATGPQLPTHADVLVLQQLSLDEVRARARRFISLLQRQDDCAHDGGDWRVGDDHSIVHLPGGASVIVYHASGALQYASGLAPLASPFKCAPGKEELERLLDVAAHKLGLPDWAGAGNTLAFERLFQSKARGADRKGNASETTLVRALGAYRQFIGGIPVLGAASVALRLAGEGQLDALSVLVRPSAGEVLDQPAIISPELAARQILLQLASLLGKAELGRDSVESAVLRFGYLDLGKRKAQRVLAPMFVAQVALRHRHVRQGYVLAVPATEKTWLQPALFGTEAVPGASRSQACTHDRADVIG
jgi:hypothetical protein